MWPDPSLLDYDLNKFQLHVLHVLYEDASKKLEHFSVKQFNEEKSKKRSICMYEKKNPHFLPYSTPANKLYN